MVVVSTFMTRPWAGVETEMMASLLHLSGVQGRRDDDDGVPLLPWCVDWCAGGLGQVDGLHVGGEQQVYWYLCGLHNVLACHNVSQQLVCKICQQFYQQTNCSLLLDSKA